MIKKFIKNKLYKILKKLKHLEQEGIYLEIRKKYNIPSSFKFNGNGIKFYGEGEIIIGANSYIGESSFLQVDKFCTIKIGQNCAISHNVKMYTLSYVSDQNFNTLDRKKYNGSISIGDGVWIGVNVIINPGITIGNNAIIGANSIVTQDIPAMAIAAGNPAIVKRFKNISSD